MHGRGQGDDGPIITPHAKSPRQLAVAMRENMVFICKPSAISADGEYICQWGDTVVVTKSGGRRLGKRAHELAVTSERRQSSKRSSECSRRDSESIARDR